MSIAYIGETVPYSHRQTTLARMMTGAILGFIRLRLTPRYRTGSMSPWRGMMKWHHLLGLVSLVFVSSFIFSGLMSMTPWGIFDPATWDFTGMGSPWTPLRHRLQNELAMPVAVVTTAVPAVRAGKE